MTTTIDRAIEGLARGLVAFGAVSDDVDAAGALLQALGWSLPPGVDDIGLTKLDFSALAASLDNLDKVLRQANPSDVDLATAYAAVAIGLAASLQAIDQVSNGLNLDTDYANATGLPGAFFGRAFNVFMIRAIGTLSPGAVSLGTLFGLFEFTHYPDDPTIFQVEHIRQDIRWDRVGKLFTDPVGLLNDVYGWRTPNFLANTLLMNLGRVVEHFVAEARVVPFPPVAEQMLTGQPTPAAPAGSFPAQLFASLDKGAGIGAYDVGVSMFPLRPTTTGGTDAGVGLAPYAFGTTQTSFDLTDTLSLQLSGSDTIQGGAAMLIRAGSAPKLVTGLLNAAAIGASSATFKVLLRTAGAADARKTLFTGPNLVVDATALSAGVGIDPGGALNPSLALNIEDGRVMLTPDSSDGFLGAIIPDGGVTIGLSLNATWSQQDGFRLQGGGGLSTSITLQQTIGPLTLQALSLAVNATTTALTASAGFTASASLGPVGVMVDTVGATIALQFNRGNLGPVDLSTAFLPPRGVGLSVDAAGVVSGSGFLFHDTTNGTYVGALQVTLQDTLTLTALGLIATTLPDGSRGYSLLVFITAQDFKPIPLGLGFMLQGIGGLVAINRTFDEQVICDGLKNDTLKTLLFPQAPATNALAIVRALESAFPARAGSYLLGLLARIGWGTPTLLQFDLALILELGARERLIALGRMTATLPTPSNALLHLTLDALGVLDFDAGTVALDAQLVDSRLAGVFAITGAGALRAGWGGSGPGKAFLLSVGGFNPRFVPPAGVPALPRVAIALSAGSNPRMTCEAYFALTSNTVQFGARAQLVASAGGFSLVGDIAFDVLFDSPVHFVADFQASVQLKAGSTNLFTVAVSGTLEGLLPLRFSGEARFEILWCSITVRVRATLRDGVSPTVAAIDALPLLLAALGNVGNWSTARPAGATQGVALRSVAANGTSVANTPAAPASSGSSAVVVLDPLGTLTVTQSVVPLGTGRDVDLVQGAPVSAGAAKRFTLTGTLGGSVTPTPGPGAAPTVVTAVPGDFAPGQYFALTEDEKLASPSFESWQAGVTLGSTAAALVDSQLVAAPLTYDEHVLDSLPTGPDTPVVLPPPRSYVLPAGQLAAHAGTGAAARAPSRRVGRARFRVAGPPQVALATPSYAVVAAATGAAVATAPDVETWSEHQAVADTLNRTGQSYVLVAVA